MSAVAVNKKQMCDCNECYLIPDGDKDSDGPSESGDNTSESTQGAPSEPAQEKGTLNTIYVIIIYYCQAVIHDNLYCHPNYPLKLY